MAQMTQKELDDLIDTKVEAKLKETEVERKSANQVLMQEIRADAEKKAFDKGYKEEPAIIKMAKIVRLAAVSVHIHFIACQLPDLCIRLRRNQRALGIAPAAQTAHAD